MLFSEAYAQYLGFIENRQKKQSIKDLNEKFHNKILPYFEDYNIYEITMEDYVNWQNEIELNDYSNNYKENLHYIFSGFLNYCCIYLDLKTNVAQRVGNFKMKNVKVKHDFYTFKEFKQFIKEFDNEVYKQFFIFMFFTGTRPGEAMALKFSDINNKIVSINKTISEHSINGKRIIDTPKTLESFRDINIDRKLYKDLLFLRKQYILENNGENIDFYVFGGLKPLAPTTINRYKKKACQKANLREIQLRNFRHSHASLLYNSKIPVQLIKERLGHANINTTMKYYVQVYENKEKRVMKTLNLFRLFF